MINYKQGDEEFVGCETNYQMFFFFFSAIWPMANHHWSVIIIIKLSLIRGKTFEKKTNKQPNRHDICYTLTKKLVIEDIFSICVWNVKKEFLFFQWSTDRSTIVIVDVVARQTNGHRKRRRRRWRRRRGHQPRLCYVYSVRRRRRRKKRFSSCWCVFSTIHHHHNTFFWLTFYPWSSSWWSIDFCFLVCLAFCIHLTHTRYMWSSSHHYPFRMMMARARKQFFSTRCCWW